VDFCIISLPWVVLMIVKPGFSCGFGGRAGIIGFRLLVVFLFGICYYFGSNGPLLPEEVFGNVRSNKNLCFKVDLLWLEDLHS